VATLLPAPMIGRFGDVPGRCLCRTKHRWKMWNNLRPAHVTMADLIGRDAMDWNGKIGHYQVALKIGFTLES
jgi:hypothetical protein